MKRLILCYEKDKEYEQLFAYARSVYLEKNFFDYKKRPNMLIGIVDQHKVHGCIGFNFRVKWDLVKKDKNFQVHKEKHVNDWIAEQCIFAAEPNLVSLPLLMSSLVAYANWHRMDWIAFAGITVSRKIIAKLNLTYKELGKVDLTLIPKDDLHIYEKWEEEEDPRIALVNTQSLPDRDHPLIKRGMSNIFISERLQPCFSVHTINYT